MIIKLSSCLQLLSHNDNPAFVNIFRDKIHEKNLNNDGNQKVNVAKHTIACKESSVR